MKTTKTDKESIILKTYNQMIKKNRQIKFNIKTIEHFHEKIQMNTLIFLPLSSNERITETFSIFRVNP